MIRKHRVTIGFAIFFLLLAWCGRDGVRSVSASGIAAVSSVFSQVGAVNIPVTTTDISTPSAPASGKTVWYTKAGTLCALSPASSETCTGSGGGGGLTRSGYYLTDGTNFFIGPYLVPVTKPVAANFSWVNQGTASEATNNGALTLTFPGKAGPSLALRITPIGATTSATILFACTTAQVNFNDCGVGFYESGTGKIQTMGVVWNGGFFLQNNCWNSTTSLKSTQQNVSPVDTGNTSLWMKLTLSSGNVTFSRSNDGVNFAAVLVNPVGDCFTTAPDNYLYFADANNSASPTIYNTLLSFLAQ